MNYQAVGNKCAISFKDKNLPIKSDDIIYILTNLLGFKLLQVGFTADSLKLIKSLKGTKYRLGAMMKDAPKYVDCSSLVQWFYMQFGIQLPRRSIQQSEVGTFISAFEERRVGDLIFASGQGHNYYRGDDPLSGIGHVAISTGNRQIIHVVPKRGIVETSEHFLLNERFRCVRRLITDPNDFYVFGWGDNREIMSADDIYWVLMKELKKMNLI